jgi:hypothetical protein
LIPKRFEDVDIFKRSLSALGGHVRCRKLYILGGEPLLHPGILAIVSAAAGSGLADEVWVKTNGLLLPRMSEEFWRLVNGVAISVYPASQRALGRHRGSVEALAESHGVGLRYTKYDRFNFITTANARLSQSIVRHVFDGCEYKTFTHSVMDGRLFRCAPSVNLEAAGQEIEEADCLNLLSGSLTGSNIAGFLARTSPLSACRYCLGSSGGTFAHAMISPKAHRFHDRHA